MNWQQKWSEHGATNFQVRSKLSICLQSAWISLLVRPQTYIKQIIVVCCCFIKAAQWNRAVFPTRNTQPKKFGDAFSFYTENALLSLRRQTFRRITSYLLRQNSHTKYIINAPFFFWRFSLVLKENKKKNNCESQAYSVGTRMKWRRCTTEI